MRVKLDELLLTRQVSHPSRFVLLNSRCNSEVQISVTGYAWWLEQPPPGLEGQITFYIEGITDGVINSELFDADPFEEDLVSFDVRPLSEFEWAKGPSCEIYCSTPLPKPMDVYANLYDFLLSVDCPFEPSRYLNMGNSETFSEFLQIASSSSFLLFKGPESIGQVVVEALEKSGPRHNVVLGKESSTDLICVRFSGSCLICKSAYAEFED